MSTQSISSPRSEQITQNSVGSDDPTMSPQSGVVNYASEVTEHQATVSFKDLEDATTTQLNSDLSDRKAAEDQSVGFEKFFARPVKIGDYQWNVTEEIDVIFNPWSLWLSDSRIANRLTNFRGFAGHLHLKVVINGNPFYWGGAQLSYMPQAGATFTPPWFSANQDYYGDLMSASQRMKIFIDPTISQGGEMVLPFIFPQDTLDLVDVGDYQRLGVCWLSALAPLRHANSSDALNISVYAWCDDIILTSPTVNDVAFLSPQMGVVDEHQVGPVEKTSAIISEVSGKMSKIPVIGKYAMASKMGADLVNNVASKFGLCKPRQVNDTMNFRLQQAGDLACIDSLDTSQTLGLNAKREVTIDPTTTGVGPEDELDFEHFCGRESLIGNFDWTQQKLPDDLLYTVPVTPNQAFVGQKTVFGGDMTVNGVTLTPAGYLMMNFTYWRGPVRIRLQVMSSAFHKGRLLLVWDPYNTTNVPEVQVQNSVVLDISKERDYQYDIQWGNPSPGLLTGPIGNPIPVGTTWSTAGTAPSYNANSNGKFSVYVLNRLTSSQQSTDPVRVNVYMSAPKLEVWAPRSGTELYTPLEILEGQSGVLFPQGGHDATVVESSSEMNVPTDTPTDSAGGESPIMGSCMLHGDPIHNWRTLIKRFTYFESLLFNGAPPVGNGSLQTVSRTTGPLYRGPQANGIHNAGTANRIPFNIMSKLACCFVGFRGSRRFKFIPITSPETTTNTVQPPYIAVSRKAGLTNGSDVATFNQNNIGFANDFLAANDTSLSGLAFTSPPQGGIIEVELPWYAGERFELTYATPNSSSRAMGYQVQSLMLSNGQNDVNLRVFAAAGDDYNVFGFTGIPTIYFWSG